MPGNSAAPRRRGAALSVAGPAILVLLILCAVAATAAIAAPRDRHHTARQVERFWTPRRMAAARPLEMTVGPGGHADVHLGPRRLAAQASNSDSVVATPEALPYAWNGRLFVMRGGKEGFCSATAIDSASGRLVLTAGHCVNTGPKDGRPGAWSTRLEFVPGFNLGAAPYGTFALSGKPRALSEWTEEGNPDFDLGAFLTEPNAAGLTLSEALGGGAKIVANLDRHQRFETFAYPGGTEQMRTCVSGFAGEDPITATLPGPSTVGIRCRWAPGASGGGWLIDGGSEIDGLTTYVRIDEKHRTFSPYFAAHTVGRLVAGL
jgi:V8-like Glu-specific endopeptidase